ncbi:Lactonase, 7-bladed beta-propeller-domain-containing protein [Lophiotrema nucula]|uniref:Lactonase, 7-bladed beta-propeller-domain-containing protein n=1 Tax=Lophiotrema nucula TaxID=690887 RepID=A0A6A5ZFN9_9PLEO|nr:Lactonase, 7-bladed beta-propeller-domain-containing protein [Lophiotrema nucula]
MRAFTFVVVAAGLGTALCDKHYMFSGFFSGSTIAGLEFDDNSLSLSVVNNISTQADSGSKWIALDARNQNLYVATTGYIQSYAITSNLSLTYETNVSLSSNCSNANFIAAASTAPYAVFGIPYSSGCSGLAISVDDEGTLKSAFANVTYDSSAGVHGIALSSDNNFIYSADDMGNAVWSHKYDNVTGTIEELQKIDAPTGANPRHLTVHPNGNWVYIIYEELSQLAVYSRNGTTGILSDTNTTFSLLPAGMLLESAIIPSAQTLLLTIVISGFTNTSSYWADEVFVSNATSQSPKYLITGTRSRTTSLPGYVSAFALDADTGAITEQLFLLPTTSSGGSANAVGPAKFSEEYFAITDSGANFVEVWKIDGGSAEAVSHVGMDSGPANVVWYS